MTCVGTATPTEEELTTDIKGRDLVAVASDEPTKGCEPRFNGKRRIRLGEVAGLPSQRLRIARRRVGESDRLVEQLRILRGGEPLALLTGRVTNEVRQNDAGRLVRVLLRNRSKPPKKRCGAIRRDRVARIRPLRLA